MSATHAQMATRTHQQLMTHANPLGGSVFNSGVFGTGASHMLEIGPGVDISDDWQNWSLSDITPAAGLEDLLVHYSKGRRDEQSVAQPGTLATNLLNTAGAYTPRNWTSPYFPFLRAGIPVRYGTNLDDGHGYIEHWSGFMTGLKPGWDQAAKLPNSALSAAGILSRLQQRNRPLKSAMTRGVASQSAGTVHTLPLAYWPMEEGDGATQAAEYFGGTALVPFGTGAVSWGADTTTPGSDALPQWATGAKFSVVTPAYTDTGSWRVQCVINIPTTETADSTNVFAWKTGGTVTNWRLTWVHASKLLLVVGYDSAGTERLAASGLAIIPGKPYFVVVNAIQNGSAVSWEIEVAEADTASLTGAEVGQVLTATTGALVGVAMTVQAGVGGLTFGQLSLFSKSDAFDGTVNFSNFDYQYANGWLAEGAIARLIRICSEESIHLANQLDLEINADLSRMPMAAQPRASTIDILRQCEAADGGFLVDGTEFGLTFYPFRGRENRAVDLTIDIATGQLAGTLAPVEDNQGLNNDVTVSSPTSSGRYVQPTGQPYAPDGVGGIGVYDGGSTTLQLVDDAILYHRAAWIVHEGTVDEDRYASLQLDLAATSALATYWHANGELDLRLAVTNAPTEAASISIQEFTEGVQVDIGTFDWTVTANCSPASPWDVFVLGTDRVDAVDSALSVTATAGATHLTVTTPRRLWTTSAAQYPFDLDVGGVKVTASGCSGGSSPQTFTISALPVQVVSGSTVRLWRPGVMAMGGLVIE